MVDSPKCKCVVVGDSSVGKTSILVTLQHDRFEEDHKIDVWDGFITDIVVEDTPCKMQLVDTCATEVTDYDSIRYLSYYDTDIVIICFSLVDRTSLENVKSRWLPEIKQHPSLRSATYMLVGTKSDLRDDQDTIVRAKLLERGEEPVNVAEGRQIAKEIGAADYVECSSRLNKNLSEVFSTAAWHCAQKNQKRRRPRRHTWRYACGLLCYACWCGFCLCCCPDKL